MNPRRSSIEFALLDRYLSGDCSPDEVASLRATLDPDGVLSSAQLNELLRRDAAGMPSVDMTARWETFKERFTVKPSPETNTRSKPVWLGRWPSERQRANPLKAMLMGSMLTLGVIAAVLIGHGSFLRSGNPSGFEYRTGVAQQLSVRLPDGTQVALAPNSHLVIRPGFNQKTREANLEGEAYFDVVPGTRAPFIIHSARLTTQVLGTSFNVRAYARDSVTEIAVASGRVALQRSSMTRAHSRIILDAGMVGQMSDSMTVLAERSDMSSYGAWRSGKLVFQNAPLRDVLNVLEHWYGLDFRIADTALATRRITLTVNEQSPSGVMSFLKTVMHVSLTFEGKDGHIITLHQSSMARPDITKPWKLHDPQSQPKEVGR